MFNLCGLGGVLPFLPYGDHWRRMRRMLTTHIGARNTLVEEPRELYFVRRCLKQLLDDPNQFYSHTKCLVGSIAISSAYGLMVQSTNDRNLQATEQLLNNTTETMEKGVFLVDIFPWLRHAPEWLPGASFQKIARESRALANDVRNSIFDQAVRELGHRGNYSSSLVARHLQELGLDGDSSEYDSDMLKDAASTIYIGAAETTWSSLVTFFLAMVCYPEIQKKAQKEIDETVRGRLPEHSDLGHLPYLMAIYLEVIRWKPIVPMGFPHSPMAEYTHEGKRIPKGSLVFPNQWAMLQDPNVYPNPSEFIPERFLKNGKIDESVRSPLDIAFGFGRRICPGQRVSQSTVMITAASVLSSFDLSMAVDEQGDYIRPKQEYHLSHICYPKEFLCKIAPRSHQARQLIEAWDISESDSP